MGLPSGPSVRPIQRRWVFFVISDQSIWSRFVQQAVGVSSDLEEPLAHLALLDRSPAALACPTLRLLGRQHRPARRAPVDGGVLLVRQARLEELHEDPLRPAVVGRVGGVDLVRPVEHHAQAAELTAEVGDVVGDQAGGVAARLDRVVLGVDPEGVEAERFEDVVASARMYRPWMSLPTKAKTLPTCRPSAEGYGNIIRL